MSDAGDLYRAGQLSAAIASAVEAVKREPNDYAVRWLLAELLIVAGEFDRADLQLDTIMALEPGAATSVVPVRQLLRAEVARRDYYLNAAIPSFLEDTPTQSMKCLLESFVQFRAGDFKKAGELAAEAEQLRPAICGRLSGESFADFRDLDDLLTGVFEVLTKTGKYYWIPVERVELLEFSKPERPLDLFWRPVRMVVRDAFDAEIHMPVTYGNHETADEASRLARRTDWLGGELLPVRGVGQRVFLVDNERELAMMEIDVLNFNR